MPRTYATKPLAAVQYWRARSLEPARIDVQDVIDRRAAYSLGRLPNAVEGEAIQGDAARVVEGLKPRFSWVITSPPYYGMRTYIPDQWLRHWFLGGPPDVEYGCSDQLPQKSADAFVAALGRVWRDVAATCTDGARLVVRFGALPSKQRSPQSMLRRSLSLADSGWRVVATVPSGAPSRGRRQATQFTSAGAYINEVDMHARLEA
jgi:hypothetical protein